MKERATMREVDEMMPASRGPTLGARHLEVWLAGDEWWARVMERGVALEVTRCDESDVARWAEEHGVEL